MNEQPLNPANTICIIKHEGREVGRIAASASNAAVYIETLARHYGKVEIEYQEDADAAMIGRMLSGPRMF